MELTGNKLTPGKYASSGHLHKLLSTRRGTIVVAVVCTMLAAGVLVYAAARYRHSVQSSDGTRSVLVASATIPKGTSGDVIASQQLFHTQTVAAKQVTAGAVADTALLHGKVAATDISPGQQITVGEFTSSGAYVTQLAPDERIISIPLDSSHGLKGVVEVGDRVDVYGDLKLGGGAGDTRDVSLLLLSNVPVMAVDQNTHGGLGAVNGASDVVLKVKASAAAALALASDEGKVWLVLRGSNAAEPTGRATAVYDVQALARGGLVATGGGR